MVVGCRASENEKWTHMVRFVAARVLPWCASQVRSVSECYTDSTGTGKRKKIRPVDLSSRPPLRDIEKRRETNTNSERGKSTEKKSSWINITAVFTFLLAAGCTDEETKATAHTCRVVVPCRSRARKKRSKTMES